MKENWANNLKQKMAGFEQPVDDALWAGIARVSVNADIRWWPWVLTALASAAVVTIVLLLQPEPAVAPVIVGSGEMVAAVEEEPVTETLVPDDTPVSHGNRPVRPVQNTTVPPCAEETGIAIPAEIFDEVAHQDVVTSDKVIREDSVEEDEWTAVSFAESSVPHRRMTISAVLYAQTSPYGTSPISDSPKADNQTSEDHIRDSAAEPEGLENEDQKEETKAMGRQILKVPSASSPSAPEWTHAFPIQIGARVSLSWSERWSIDTGLTFMHFNSWNAGTQQKMEFLGIPLYVNYLIGSAHNFSFYTSAGGQAFKCFAGNAPDKPWLFSCGLGVGAEYNFSPVVSMYAEPEVDWYFHTGESCHYYTDNPFAFSLSLGFRLHF